MVRDSAQVGYHSIGRRGQEEGLAVLTAALGMHYNV